MNRPSTQARNPGPKGAPGGARKRAAAAAPRRAAGRTTGGVASGNATTNGILRFYTDEAPGLRIGPTTVLFLSMFFICLVVVMHMAAKVAGGGKPADVEA
eukprot:g645.t1